MTTPLRYLLIGTLCALLAACNGSSSPSATAPNDNSDITTPEPPPVDDNNDDESPSSVSGDAPAEAPNIDAEVRSALADAKQCDYLDDHYCLFPFPNDYFTKASQTRATGRQVNLALTAMPKNILGKPVDPTEWNKNDGFSPGNPILVRVPELDLDASGAVSLTQLPTAFDNDQPIVLIDADTGERQLIWSELDANITAFTPCRSFSLVSALTELAGKLSLPLDPLADLSHLLEEQCDNTPLDSTNPLADPGPALIIRPAKNLEEGHRYIVALRHLKNSAGDTLEAPATFRIFRDNHVSDLAPINDRRKHMESLFHTLADAGIARDSLYLTWDFTVISTDNLSGRLRHMVTDAVDQLDGASPSFRITNPEIICQVENPDDLLSQLPLLGGALNSVPVLGDILTRLPLGEALAQIPLQELLSDSPLGDGLEEIPSPIPLMCRHPNGIQNYHTDDNTEIARTVRGTIDVPSYLSLPNGRTGSTLVYGDDGLPVQNPITPMQTMSFTCNIPRAAFNNADDPAAATEVTPARPSLYGHGLLGNQAEVGAGNVSEMAQRGNMIFCATDWIGMATGNIGEDPTFGDLPNVLTILLDLSGFGSLPDRLQQAMVNFHYLGRALLAEDGFCSHPAFQDSEGHCVINRESLYYDGNSQGGIFGGVIAATSPDIRRAALGVPGMNYSTLLQRSVDFDTYASLLYAAYPNSLDQQMALALMPMLWDRGENDGYAAHLHQGNAYPEFPQAKVLMQVAYGDHQVSMTSAEVMARTIGAKLHCPAVIGGTDKQQGDAVQPGVNLAVEKEAEVFPDLGLHRRHPDDYPYYGLDCITQYPFNGNALTIWDSGPTVLADGSPNDTGVAPPPANNTPPRPELGYGADPHSFPRSTAEAQEMKLEFLNPEGEVIDTCHGSACTTREFQPLP